MTCSSWKKSKKQYYLCIHIIKEIYYSDTNTHTILNEKKGHLQNFVNFADAVDAFLCIHLIYADSFLSVDQIKTHCHHLQKKPDTMLIKKNHRIYKHNIIKSDFLHFYAVMIEEICNTLHYCHMVWVTQILSTTGKKNLSHSRSLEPSLVSSVPFISDGGLHKAKASQVSSFCNMSKRKYRYKPRDYATVIV